jgi:predicted Zn-dependent protease
MGNFDLESGRRYLQEGEYAEALRCLLSSVQADPADPDVYLALIEAYEMAWEASGDPLVLDQVRKVAMAGLKRRATSEQRAHLTAALDRVDALLLEEQQAEAEASGSARKILPLFKE